MKELKGACIIGQSGGPTSVINASAYGVIDTALKSPCITQVLGAEHGIKGVLNDVCENVHIVNEMDVPILAMGLHDVVISASAEGILVSDKEQSSYIKPYVDKFVQQTMFAEKSWGSFRVLDVEEASMTIKVTLNPGHCMNYHSHQYRDEVWVVISGQGRTVVDGMEQKVAPGDVITMQAGCRHTVFADTELKLIEVQLGRNIYVGDKGCTLTNLGSGMIYLLVHLLLC